jgi:hypothetical protein
MSFAFIYYIDIDIDISEKKKKKKKGLYITRSKARQQFILETRSFHTYKHVPVGVSSNTKRPTALILK